jgi:hypothetical protein
MANVSKWSGVAVAMESALGAAKTITEIAVGATATVTATHDFSVGDYVKFDVLGMHQINGRVFRVLSVSTTVSFVIEDTAGGSLNTSDFSEFSSGTVSKITFGTSITTATNISASGGDFDFIDTTTIHDNVKTQIPGSANPLSYSFDNLWDASDAGQIAMKVASDAQAQKAFKFVFGTGGRIMVMNGYVGYAGAPTGSAQDKVVSPAVITAFGSPTYYAS